MKILPISNNNINLQKKQQSPTFQARINPNILAQLKGKTEPLEKLVVKSAVGALSVSAATVAAYFLNNNDADENIIDLIANPNSEINEFKDVESIKNVSPEDLYMVVTAQDKDGKTILHQGFDLDTLNFLRENLDEDQFVAALSIEDNDNVFAANACNVDDIGFTITSPDFDSLSLENTIKLLSNIKANSNVIDFLKIRLEKEHNSGNPVSAAIPTDLYDNIIYLYQDGVYGVKTKLGTFPCLEHETIAELFEIDEENHDLLKLDRAYIPMASPNALEDIMVSALNSSTDMVFENLCDSINAIKDNDKKVEVLEATLSENLGYLNDKHLETIYKIFGTDMYKKVFKMSGGDENTIFHIKGFKNSNLPSVENIWENFKQLVPFEFMIDVITTKNREGAIPLHNDEGFVEAVIKYCGNKNPILIKNILSIKNDADIAVIQCCHTNQNIFPNIFQIFSDREDDLADILLTAINPRTPIGSFIQSEMLKSKILELATDSDLSIEKSIQLLEASKLEPQILEYLKLQQQALLSKNQNQ